MCHGDIFRKNPAAELFSEHHSQQTKESNDWRGGTLYANDSVQSSDKQPTANETISVFISSNSSPASVRLRSHLKRQSIRNPVHKELLRVARAIARHAGDRLLDNPKGAVVQRVHLGVCDRSVRRSAE